MKKTYLFVMLCISSLAFAGAPLLIEDFNYTAGEALTLHNWAIHSGTSNPLVVTSPGLTFTNYVGSGIGLSTGLNNTGDDENRSFGAQTTAGSIYASFLVNIPTNTATSSYFFHFFDPLLNTAFRARTFITPQAGQIAVGFSFNASTAQATSPTLLNFGETYLFVAKYTIVDGATNDNVSLYVFRAGDDLSVEPATPTLGPLSTADATADIVPTCVALRQWDANQRITVDGIRVRREWDLVDDNNVVTGLSQLNGNQTLTCFPNPVTDGFVNLANADSSLKEVQIFDLVGKKVFNQQTVSNRLDVSSLNAGIYVIKVAVDNKTTRSEEHTSELQSPEAI